MKSESKETLVNSELGSNHVDGQTEVEENEFDNVSEIVLTQIEKQVRREFKYNLELCNVLKKLIC